ncbi:MAG: MFS transporter, partial [Amphiplicatus sp.]
MSTAHNRTVVRVMNRIGLFLFAELLLNSIDRVNVSFAALQMNDELGFDPKIYGFGVGIFFVSYILLQVPAAEILRRYGAARPLSFMIIAWGLVSFLSGFIYDPYSFYFFRFLLGAAEAGSSTATLLYMSTWVPQAAAGRFMSRVAMAMPLAMIVGGPLSGFLMTAFHEYGDISGWRWMFYIEGGATVLFGLWALTWLKSSPAEAKWLTSEERNWLVSAIESEGEANRIRLAASGASAGGGEIRTTLHVVTNPVIWLLALGMFGVAMGFYGLTYWLPQVISMMTGNTGVMLITALTAVPALCNVLGMWIMGWSADRSNERRYHFFAGTLIGFTGLGLAPLAPSPSLALLLLCVGGFGLGGAHAVFFGLPVGFLRGAPAAATGFAFINMLASSAGLIGANVIAALRASSGSFSLPLYMM